MRRHRAAASCADRSRTRRLPLSLWRRRRRRSHHLLRPPASQKFKLLRRAFSSDTRPRHRGRTRGLQGPAEVERISAGEPGPVNGRHRQSLNPIQTERTDMARAKRKKPHNPAKVHDRRSRDLLRNAEVAAIEVDDPLALEPGEKIVTLRSIRNDPLAKLHSHRQIDEAQYQGGRAFQDDWEQAERGPRAVDPTPGICRWRAGAGADHGTPAQGRAAAEPRRARTRRRRLRAGARCPGFRPDHGGGRAAARFAHPALGRLFRAAISRVPGSAGADLWVCDGEPTAEPAKKRTAGATTRAPDCSRFAALLGGTA